MKARPPWHKKKREEREEREDTAGTDNILVTLQSVLDSPGSEPQVRLQASDVRLLVQALQDFRREARETEVRAKAKLGPPALTSIIESLHTLDEARLMKAWSVLQNATRQESARIVGDHRVGYTLVPKAVGDLAANVATMLGCQRRNDRESLAIYEHAAKLSLARIPEDVRARWDLDRLLARVKLAGKSGTIPASKAS